MSVSSFFFGITMRVKNIRTKGIINKETPVINLLSNMNCHCDLTPYIETIQAIELNAIRESISIGT